MGLLISSYLGLKNEDDLTFEAFKAKYLSRESSLDAKKTFDGLRRLQKRFEDAYYEVHEHNMIGAILRLLDSLNQKKFIQYYFVDDNRHQNYLQKYYKLVFLGLTHDEIIEHKREEFVNKYDLTYKSINHDFLYYEDKKAAFRLLLRLNIDQDILQNRFFNFKIWEGGERSLEHIQAKSKVGHYEDGLWLDGNNEQHENNSDFTMLRDDIQIKMPDNSIMKTTEHSIGNLVLLYKNENSSFNASDFSQKKELFFSPNRTELIRSRHLLHTICVFAEQQDWNGESIAFNKRKTIEKFEKDYNELKSEFKYEEQD